MKLPICWARACSERAGQRQMNTAARPDVNGISHTGRTCGTINQKLIELLLDYVAVPLPILSSARFPGTMPPAPATDPLPSDSRRLPWEVASDSGFSLLLSCSKQWHLPQSLLPGCVFDQYLSVQRELTSIRQWQPTFAGTFQLGLLLTGFYRRRQTALISVLITVLMKAGLI